MKPKITFTGSGNSYGIKYTNLYAVSRLETPTLALHPSCRPLRLLTATTTIPLQPTLIALYSQSGPRPPSLLGRPTGLQVSGLPRWPLGRGFQLVPPTPTQPRPMTITSPPPTPRLMVLSYLLSSHDPRLSPGSAEGGDNDDPHDVPGAASGDFNDASFDSSWEPNGWGVWPTPLSKAA
jgi:hypothetical protein